VLRPSTALSTEIEEGGARHAEHQIKASALLGNLGAPRDQRHEGQYAAFAPVVGAHHDQDVLQRDDDDQCPGDQRQDAQDIVMHRLQAGKLAEALFYRIERAGADVAEHHAQSGQREGRRALSAHLGGRSVYRHLNDVPSSATPLDSGRGARVLRRSEAGSMAILGQAPLDFT
jgi:hypothetical protein